jgi:hypothetical protein
VDRRLPEAAHGPVQPSRLATAWASSPDPARRIPVTVAAYCVCSHGRWIKKAHAEKDASLLRWFPDFGEVLDGLRPAWLAHPPEREEWQPAEPAAPVICDNPERAVMRAQIATMFRPAS